MQRICLMHRWLLLSAIFVLSACGNEAQPIEESRSLNEIEVSSFNGRSAIETHDNVDEMEAIEIFTPQRVNELLSKVEYEIEQWYLKDTLYLVVHPMELEKFETDEEGALEIAIDLIRELKKTTGYQSLQGLTIYFGLKEPLYPVYEDFQGSDREVGKIEIHSEILGSIDSLDESSLKETVEASAVFY